MCLLLRRLFKSVYCCLVSLWKLLAFEHIVPGAIMLKLPRQLVNSHKTPRFNKHNQ